MKISHELVRTAAQGDAQAVRQIVDALQRPFYNLALRMLGTHMAAEEATQEALLRVVTHLGAFRGDSRFSTWAWTLATRAIRDVVVRERRQPMSIDAFAEDLAAGADEGAAERPEDAVLLGQVKLGCGRAMLQCLDDDHRLAYVLGDILELEGPVAAAAMDVTAATFRKRLSRARQRVQAHLQQVCGLVDEANPCRCAKRLAPARALGRLEPRDGVNAPSLAEVRAQVAAVEELTRHRVFYRMDPQAPAPEVIAQRVRAALGVG